MVKINKDDFPDLLIAVTAWTGYENSPFPSRLDSSVFSHFDESRSKTLISMVNKIEKYFYLSSAKDFARNISEMKLMAIHDFKIMYPELDDRIAQAFAWCYTFDFK